ncbi:hypothetical protein [Pendulispora albinea]|uniref:Uncharacterized protein n=1 Tax=Pendulispora albinea TaxID=2741071 RepID=A0ABZ2M0B2_9BACT
MSSSLALARHHVLALTAAGVLGLALGSGACSSDSDNNGGAGGPSKGDVSSAAYQENGRCPSSSTPKLPGTKSIGASCSSYRDCMPSCCSCSSSGSYAAAACIDGRCALKSETCDVSKKLDYCPSDPDPHPSPRDGGTSGGGGSTQCVDGTANYCYGTDFNWTGSQCCVSHVTQCVSGTANYCYGSDFKWTGKVCCITKSAICTAGTANYCYGTNRMWTGSQCCVSDVSQCVDGTANSCYGTGKYWTGSKCCI